MTTTTRGLWMMVSALLLGGASGCALDGDGKDSCVTQADCFTGFVCVDQVCEDPAGGGGPGGGDDDDVDDDDGPGGGSGGDGSEEEFGTVSGMAPATTGLAAINDYETLISLTTAGGGLGCALVGDEAAAPGGAAAVLSVKPDSNEHDDRCPYGTYGLLDDPDVCGRVDPVTGLTPGCAAYRAWGASGEPSAFRLATGGYVAIEATLVGENEMICDVEVSATFAGGVTIDDSFSFSYDPFASESAFCTN